MKLKGLPAISVTHTTSLFLGKEWMFNRLCQSAGASEAEKHIEWRVFLVLTVGLQFPGAWLWGSATLGIQKQCPERLYWWYKAQHHCCGGSSGGLNCLGSTVCLWL